MFEKKISLFSMFGFKVSLDITWFILAILIVWSLAKGVFPEDYQGLSSSVYLWMGIVGALGLFASIVFHEFCHSVVARHYGIPMKGITLFIFGGVAEMSDEPPSAKVEFLMAIVGPLSSFVLSGIFYLLAMASNKAGLAVPIYGVLAYLSWLNFILAVFNLIPAFPLDGGRVLRSILWGVKGNLKWATHIASFMGSGFGIILMALGVISFIGGNFVGGLWSFLIGMFIRGASQMSYRQMIIRKAITGEHIERFMTPNPVTVTPEINATQLVQDYFYRYHYKMFPVVENGCVKGCITTKEVKEIPPERWSEYTVGSLAKPCSWENTISLRDDAVKVLALMNQTGNSRLMVMDGEKLAGIVTLKDLLQFLSMKIDLEEKEEVKMPF
jgi:Zn-dependent protease/predicted transcriptional regulator